MLLRDKEYLIIREVSKSENSAQYILKNSFEDDFYKVLIRKKDSIDANLIRFLSAQTKNKSFTDFKDYMNDFENLYVFMNYSDHQSLETKLNQEECTLLERLTIAKKIIEKIIILDIPPYFSYCSLDAQKILVDKTLEIYFDYDMQEISRDHNIKEGQCVLKLAKIFKLLFQKELEREIMPEMQTLIYQMEYGEIPKISDVFERFYRIFTNESPLSQSNAFSEKLVEKFKKLLSKLGFLMKFILIGIAIYYLFASINAYKTHEYNENFTQIGIFDV